MNFNELLHRPIADGRQFENLIPKIKCEFTYSGQGDTDLSIKNMKAVVEKFSSQMTEVAAVLKQSSLENTVEAVFNFCYDHFQYKADDEDQMLRSPACSWSERFIGIDCKSYSILASSILSEMNLTHYIRKIKQPSYEPTEYTHVYVVIPANQKTGSLNEGYYVIDGTVEDNQEPAFIGKSDLLMLKHYSSLNAPAPFALAAGLASGPDDEPAGATGTGQTVWGTATTQAGNYASGYVAQNSKGWFKKVNFENISAFFSKGCVGGTAYTDAWLTEDVLGMGKYCQLVMDEINVALATNNMPIFNAKVNEFIGMVHMFVHCAVTKTNSQQWNGCSRTNFFKLIDGANFYFNVLRPAFNAWLDKYFTYVVEGSRNYSVNNVTTPNNIMPFSGWVSNAPTQNIPFKMFTKKSGDIPVFQPTKYLFDLKTNPAAFNANDFLNSLQQAYNTIQNPTSIFTGGTNSGTPGTVPGSTPGNNSLQPVDTPKASNAGLNLVAGGLILGALVYGGMQVFGKDKPLKSTK